MHAASNFISDRAYSISSNSSNGGEIFRELNYNYKGLYRNSGKGKEGSCLVLPSTTKRRKMRTFHAVVVLRR